MKPNLPSTILLGIALLLTGCTEKATATQSAQEDAAAKARAEALKKEMKTAPKVFSNLNPLKTNQPPNQPDAKSAATPENKP
jgi:hypothetical protein